MRDIVLTAFLLGSIPFILRRPAWGALIYAWVSIMTPHRLTWGFAYDFPFAFIIAIATLAGMFLSRDANRRLPVTPTTLVLFLLVVWMSLSTVFAFDTVGSTSQYIRVMKIQFMVFVTMYLLYSKEHVNWLIWVLAGSVAYFGIKGGIFTLVGGGAHRVYGPEGWIQENNALALATIMTIPLLRYIHLQVKNRWVRLGLLGSMVVCGFSALGSQSRGALVAIAGMLAVFWSRSRNKFVIGLFLALLVPVAIGFMPDTWERRMRTMETYEEDASAMGRLNAWTLAWNLAKDHPFTGGGYDIWNISTFARYAPNPFDIHVAHSIYFSMMGEHGFVGLGLFLLLWYLMWRDMAWIVREARKREGWQWAADLASMIQVSLVGYCLGGAFLSLAYYDVPYYLLAAGVVMRALLEKEIKSTSPIGWARPMARAGGPPSNPTPGALPGPRPAGKPVASATINVPEANRASPPPRPPAWDRPRRVRGPAP